MPASEAGRGHQVSAGVESKKHPDFQLPWVQALINAPNALVKEESHQKNAQGNVTGAMMTTTLAHAGGVRARIMIERPCSEPDSLTGTEDVLILSIGNALDGMIGRAHGGFNSMVLDHVTGTAAARESKTHAPATAYLHVEYKAPVPTPGVLMTRAWVTETSGRKTFVKGVLEDGSGKVLATGKSLFVSARAEPKPSL